MSSNMKKRLSLVTSFAVAFVMCFGTMSVFAEKAFAGIGDVDFTITCPTEDGVQTTGFYYEKTETEEVGHLYRSSDGTRVENISAPVTYSAVKNTGSPGNEEDAVGPKVSNLIMGSNFKFTPGTKYKVTVRSNDGKSSVFTMEELFETERYTFPHADIAVDPEEDGFAATEAQKKGKEKVDPIIDLAIKDGKRADTFCFGQVSPTERTRPAFVKKVIGKKGSTTPGITIEEVESFDQISNESDANVSVPNNSTIEMGTEINFGGSENSSPYETEEVPLHNLYYTTDGSDPTLESALYNWYSYDGVYKYNAFVAEKFGTLTVKTKAYRHGYLPSEVKTFNYKVTANFNKNKGAMTLNKTKVIVGVKPTVTVTVGADKQKVDKKYYTVSYSGITKVGTATAKVTGKDLCSGTLSKTFTVIPAKAEFAKVTPGKKKVTVKIKSQKASGVTKYQIAYKKASAKKWKTVTTTSLKKTIKKLKKGKKYNFKVRAYGKTGYGAYSKVKTVKVK